VFEGVRPKAVMVGIVTDLGATFVAMMLLTSLFGSRAGVDSISNEEARQLVNRAMQDPAYLLLGGMLGLAATTLGGYVAARVAEVAPLLNAACVGLFDLALGIVTINQSPLWYSLAGILLTLPAAITGGVLWRRAVQGSSS
jgi:hypothetical protein